MGILSAFPFHDHLNGRNSWVTMMKSVAEVARALGAEPRLQWSCNAERVLEILILALVVNSPGGEFAGMCLAKGARQPPGRQVVPGASSGHAEPCRPADGVPAWGRLGRPGQRQVGLQTSVPEALQLLATVLAPSCSLSKEWQLSLLLLLCAEYSLVSNQALC